jgi:ATP/ADP translocase
METKFHYEKERKKVRAVEFVWTLLKTEVSLFVYLAAIIFFIAFWAGERCSVRDAGVLQSASPPLTYWPLKGVIVYLPPWNGCEPREMIR